MSTDLRVSVLVENQFPEFVREEGPKLVAFIKAYYEWMETSGQAIDVTKSILDYQDIDKTLDQFIDYFAREVMSTIPKSALADKKLLVKNIQDFYKTKGTENSYKLLFRILYNEEIELFYPGQDILRVSDGRWQFEKILRLTEPTNGNVYNLGGQVITGLTSGATAKVDKVLSALKNGVIVYECYISNISGEFVDTEIVRNSDSTITGAAVSEAGSIVRVTVDQINNGSGHVSGDKVNFISTSGTNANGYVIGVSNTGGIVSVGIENSGSNYKRLDNLIISNTVRAAANAVGYPITTAVISTPGRYIDTKGFVSWNNKIQDSNYYQEYSYVIRSENVISKYREFVTNLLHPGGNKMFGEVAVRVDVDVPAEIAKEYVYSIVSDADAFANTSILIDSQYAEVFESNVFEVNTPIVDTANTSYVVVIEPINDNISDLDIHVEYINEVEFTHTNEISLDPIESTLTFNVGMIVNPSVTPGSIDSVATVSIDNSLHFEFLDPFAGIESTVVFSNNNMLIQSIQDPTFTVINVQSYGTDMNIGRELFVPTVSVDGRWCEIKDASILDFAANTINEFSTFYDLVKTERFGISQVNFEFMDPFDGIGSTIVFSNDDMLVHVIHDPTLAISSTASFNNEIKLEVLYTIPSIDSTTTFNSGITANFEFLDPFVGIEPITTTLSIDNMLINNIQDPTFTIVNGQLFGNGVLDRAFTLNAVESTEIVSSNSSLHFEFLDPFPGVESSLIIPVPLIDVSVFANTIVSTANVSDPHIVFNIDPVITTATVVPGPDQFDFTLYINSANSTLVIPLPTSVFNVDVESMTSEIYNLLSDTTILTYANNTVDAWSGIEINNNRQFGSITLEQV